MRGAREVVNDRHDPDPHAVLTARVLAAADAVGRFIEWWGFKAITGRVWVLLCVSEQALSQHEIATLLGVSRSLISGTIAELVDYRLVRPVGQQRGAPYVANLDVWATISDVLRAREWMILETVRQALDAAVQEAKRHDASHGPLPYSLKRLKLLLRMTELAQMLLRMLISLGSATLPEGLVGWLARAVELTADLRSQEAPPPHRARPRRSADPQAARLENLILTDSYAIDPPSDRALWQRFILLIY